MFKHLRAPWPEPRHSDTVPCIGFVNLVNALWHCSYAKRNKLSELRGRYIIIYF